MESFVRICTGLDTLLAILLVFCARTEEKTVKTATHLPNVAYSDMVLGRTRKGSVLDSQIAPEEPGTPGTVPSLFSFPSSQWTRRSVPAG